MTNKVCVIIGGGSGMGAAVAKEMNNRNYNLALMSPSKNCEILANELGGIAVRGKAENSAGLQDCLLYTSPSPRDGLLSRMPSSA